MAEEVQWVSAYQGQNLLKDLVPWSLTWRGSGTAKADERAALDLAMADKETASGLEQSD